MPKLLSPDETRNLVNSYVKSFGQRGAARKLAERGYRSPTGKPISQGHIFKILNGVEICFQSREGPQETKADNKQLIEPPKETAPQIVVKEEEPAPWSPKPLIDQSVADNFAALTEEEQQKIDDDKAFAELRREELLNELEEEVEEEEQEPRRSKKHLQKVPSPSDYTHREHPMPAQHARLHAVFNRRGDVEFETDESGEEKLFFGIPRLRKAPLTICRPYQPKHYGQNRLSTR
jgi:hypothetical protein